jgi:hypothetical protein
MTEQEWLTCTDPTPILHFLLGTDHPRVQAVETFPTCIGSDRKLRLFACACYHRIRRLLPDVHAQAAAAIAEQVADATMPAHELYRAEANIRQLYDSLEGRWRVSRGLEHFALLPTHEALALALVMLWSQAQKAAYYACSNASHALAAIANPGAASYEPEFIASRVAEEQVHVDLLRCIFGNPFRPIAFDPSWRTPSVLNLVQAIYEHRAFDCLPLLAGALEEVGCRNAELLAHCRWSWPHVRGCWVVDLVLGKE